MSANNMQAVYDVLEAKGRRMTAPEIAGALWLHRRSIGAALRGLVRVGAVVASGEHSARQYELTESATRPIDGRGRPKIKGGASCGE